MRSSPSNTGARVCLHSGARGVQVQVRSEEELSGLGACTQAHRRPHAPPSPSAAAVHELASLRQHTGAASRAVGGSLVRAVMPPADAPTRLDRFVPSPPPFVVRCGAGPRTPSIQRGGRREAGRNTHVDARWLAARCVRTRSRRSARQLAAAAAARTALQASAAPPPTTVGLALPSRKRRFLTTRLWPPLRPTKLLLLRISSHVALAGRPCRAASTSKSLWQRRPSPRPITRVLRLRNGASTCSPATIPAPLLDQAPSYRPHSCDHLTARRAASGAAPPQNAPTTHTPLTPARASLPLSLVSNPPTSRCVRARTGCAR